MIEMSVWTFMALWIGSNTFAAWFGWWLCKFYHSDKFRPKIVEEHEEEPPKWQSARR